MSGHSRDVCANHERAIQEIVRLLDSGGPLRRVDVELALHPEGNRAKAPPPRTGLLCYLCMVDGHPTPPEAITVADGTAVCEPHMGLIRQGLITTRRWTRVQ